MFDFDALFEEERRETGPGKSPGALRQGAFVALIVLLAVSAVLSYLDVATI